jgi:hypothetical protein
MRKSVTVRLNDERQAKLEFLQAFYTHTFKREISDKEVLLASLDMHYEGLLNDNSKPLSREAETSASPSPAGG